MRSNDVHGLGPAVLGAERRLANNHIVNAGHEFLRSLRLPKGAALAAPVGKVRSTYIAPSSARKSSAPSLPGQR